jgi:hypothetical protein
MRKSLATLAGAVVGAGGAVVWQAVAKKAKVGTTMPAMTRRLEMNVDI